MFLYELDELSCGRRRRHGSQELGLGELARERLEAFLHSLDEFGRKRLPSLDSGEEHERLQSFVLAAEAGRQGGDLAHSVLRGCRPVIDLGGQYGLGEVAHLDAVIIEEFQRLGVPGEPG